jgi:hypothetical protein
MPYLFPFGEPVRAVLQKDRTPKRLFVLGVYASAVHARWLNPSGKERVRALAVASEPEIFWLGDKAEAEDIIAGVWVPQEVGSLTLPTDEDANGPSGRLLESQFLRPIRIDRADAWLCDLLPESRVNPQQACAIYRPYVPLMREFALPVPTVPLEPKMWTTAERRQAILDELRESGAEALILLGDRPIAWFLSHFHAEHRRLSDFGTGDRYGRFHTLLIPALGRSLQVLPLAHPRKVGKLGRSSERWHRGHFAWLQRIERQPLL